jgi:CubicO group peptidase (beta-lactamase class C family)
MRFTTTDAARLRGAASRLLDEHHLPGLAVGVVCGDDLVFSEAFGHSDIESRTPMTPEHRQRIASITKTMVALCAMALVDEGRLSLDDCVPRLLPDINFEGPAESLSIRHLLTHTGGIGEAPDISQLKDPFAVLFGAPSATLAEGYAGGFTIEVQPGTKWAYANHGYFLLGEIVSRTEGVTLPEVAQRRIYEPLGMVNTDMLDRRHQDLSTGYHRVPSDDERELLLRAGRNVPDEETVDGTNIRGEFVEEWGRGAAGGVQSTIPDMARYAAALLRRGAGIVRPQTFDLMVSRQWDPHPALQAWGLGLGVRTLFGRRSFGHGGNAFGGWNSNLGVFPDDGIATIIHTNVTFPKFNKVVQRIKQAVLDAPDFAETDTAIDASLLGAATGVYEAPIPGPLTNFRIMTGLGRIQISNQDGALVLYSRRGDWKHGVRLVPVGAADQDVFALHTGDPDPSLVAVVRASSGEVVGLHVSDGPWHLQRAENVQPWA